ncbi:MAG: hypothetical protein AVDCRST_MAG12-3607 [uncultured Rubrobacteraceae bacterium]|uniref:HTH cro/C1-type domain-containing protein n=1 Tax=uncultured Rubrobacteraceae bacterium TaxID=349277 RepID=A0A6J4TAG7_9ACTN|nr:MAG: hypothetical protein AVDCRST_MAG12-3607 [uncultured Rubrobacteraceae bacterium]
MTQEQLAEAAGGSLSANTIGNIERGKGRPYRHTLESLCDALGLVGEEREGLLAARVSATRAETGPTAPPADPIPSVSAPALPTPATPLIGRRREADEVAALLGRPGVRLVTLTGTGGTGKTRLALEVASLLSGAYRDGSRFVDLSPIGDPELVPSAVAGALGVKEQAGIPLADGLTGYLRGKELLLVLDNLEQVLPAAPLIGRILSSCPGLAVLATSRVSLHLYGEYEYRVPPLALPQSSDPEAILSSEAVRLFGDRAKAVRSGFDLTAENAPAVAEICRRLDGLPLAIELAAARVRIFPPDALLVRLSSRLGTLTGGARDLPERQRTLRAALDWSFELLRPEERRVFARLGVFASGFDLEAAGAVLDHREADSLDAFCALPEHGLLEVGEGESGEPRFRMLETVREYALARLVEAGEDEEARRCHTEHYLELADAAERRRSDGERGWWEPLEAERDNLRAALSWASEAGGSGYRFAVGLRLGTALLRFWKVRGYPSEGLGWLEALLAAAEGSEDPELWQPRARALLAAGDLAFRLEEFRRALLRYAEVLEVYRSVGDETGMARALLGMGNVRLAAGDAAGVERPVREALALFRALEDAEGESDALRCLGNLAERRGDAAGAVALGEELLSVCRDAGDARGVAILTRDIGARLRDQGELARAGALLEESVALARSIGHDGLLGRALHELGEAALLSGHHTRAMALQEESLALSRREGHKLFEAQSLTILGHAARGLGETDRATRFFLESLALFRELEQRWGAMLCLAGLAGVAADSGQFGRAARLLGAVEANNDGPPVIPAHRAEYERTAAAARSALGDAEWAAARMEGRGMSIGEAVAYGLDGATLEYRGAPPAPPTPGASAGPQATSASVP